MTQGFSGVGKVTAYDRTLTGSPGRGVFFGNCPKLSLSHTPNPVERQSSMSPARGPLRRQSGNTASAIELVCDEFNKANMSRMLLARADSVAQAATQTYTFPMTDVAVGDTIKIPGVKSVSDLVITDSTAGTPKTLAAASYELDPFDGSILIKALTAQGGGNVTQPLKAAFTKGAVVVLAGMTMPEKEIWLGFSGTNTDTNEPCSLDVYRVRFAISDVMEFINSDGQYQDWTLKGTVLEDLTKRADDVGGNYYGFAIPATHE